MSNRTFPNNVGQQIDRRAELAFHSDAFALLQSLIDVAAVRQTNEGGRTEMGTVHVHLTGPRFRAHVESIVEKSGRCRRILLNKK